MRMHRTLGGLAILAALAACETTSGVLPMGPDTYTITGTSEFGGAAGAKKVALIEANQYCQAMGKHLLPLNTNEGTRLDWAGDPVGHYSLDFRCLNANDPELRRPNMQKTADVVVEHR